MTLKPLRQRYWKLTAHGDRWVGDNVLPEAHNKPSTPTPPQENR